MPFTVNVILTENFAEIGLLKQIKLPNLPQIRHRKQNLPPAQNRGAVTFLDSGYIPLQVALKFYDSFFIVKQML